MDIQIREEHPNDIEAISMVTKEAFKDIPQSDGTEELIISKLRDTGHLSLSLVAVGEEGIVGHIAFSRVKIGECDGEWYGLGPVSVLPEYHFQGIGTALIKEGLERLRSMGAGGCILVGEPTYYKRFGFKTYAHIRYGGVPHEYVMGLFFTDNVPYGEIMYNRAFNLENETF